MLIHASGQIYPGFFLFTYGGSSHYAIKNDEGAVLFDPGLSIHVPYLYKRMEDEMELKPDQIKDIFITHLHPERIAAIPYLRKKANFALHGSLLMQEKLSNQDFVKEIYEQNREIAKIYGDQVAFEEMPFDEFEKGLKIDQVFPDTESITVSEVMKIRCMKAAGHSEESYAFVIEPYDFLIVDEGFGYFRGKDLAAPGGDWNLIEALNTIKRFNDIVLAAICFPNVGMITGLLVKTHLQKIIENHEDLLKECQKEDVSAEDKIASLKRVFYTSLSRDPLVHFEMERTFKAVQKQLSLLSE